MNAHKDWRFSPRWYGASPQWAQLGIAEAEKYETLDACYTWQCSHLFISFISVDDVVYGKQYGAHIVQPLRTNRHCSRKASVKAGVNPGGTIIRW